MIKPLPKKLTHKLLTHSNTLITLLKSNLGHTADYPIQLTVDDDQIAADLINTLTDLETTVKSLNLWTKKSSNLKPSKNSSKLGTPGNTSSPSAAATDPLPKNNPRKSP